MGFVHVLGAGLVYCVDGELQDETVIWAASLKFLRVLPIRPVEEVTSRWSQRWGVEMSINVKDVQQPGAHAAGTAAGKAANTAATGAVAPNAKLGAGAAGDSVSLTQAGLQLAQMEQQLAKQPAVDSQRVDQVRQKLQSGNYSIDPARIANKLLGFEFPAKS